MNVGEEYQFGGKEIGIDHPISRADYLSGRCFGHDSSPLITSCPAPVNTSALSRQFKPLKTSISYKTPAFKKTAIELEPVGFISKGSGHPLQDRAIQSSWTANW